jgi:hypothetical protein
VQATCAWTVLSAEAVVKIGRFYYNL